ncbi:T9SS type A sorting domain-containing protein [Brumimicrobium oceani]|uniref:Uncharacterized protein n=1 Tax=Brumimicrobium oceani TaxID=2100725 RepID=A0A2U2XB55_9FLAO|nr:PCMD domain-containing protein [Brumimicrobium oceani]PWH85039.1 hypothetical protein DIT68_11755 [Brumimicrobium oceani]
MKNPLFFIPLILFVHTLSAQQQMQNSGFENWDDEGSAIAEPTNWSSIKTADALAAIAPEVLHRVAGRTGNYAIELEVKTLIGISANGIITNGRVHADYTPSNGYVFTDAGNPKWHTEFSGRPDSLVGWYKYAPMSGDKGKIEIILHSGTEGRLPRNNATINNEIANLRVDFVTPQTEWTRFSKAFNYKSAMNPAYILTTIAAGDSTISKEGTKLIIDDLELIYNSLEVDDFAATEIAVNGSNGFLYFTLENQENVSYQVADLSGKVIQSGKAKTKIPFNHDSGIYFIMIQNEREIFTKKLYILQ